MEMGLGCGWDGDSVMMEMGWVEFGRHGDGGWGGDGG